jgi:phosphoglycolate phosphatase-like HAD superfamily hydrolase
MRVGDFVMRNVLGSKNGKPDVAGVSRRNLLVAATAVAATGAIGATASAQQPSSDALASWNGGATKKSITDFVARVTMVGGADFVPPAERIAVFDNDGTLWSEQPLYFQLAYAIDRVKALAPQHPEWKDLQPFRGLIEGDIQPLVASGANGLHAIVAATHAGLTTEEFNGVVSEWIATARHPRFKRPYTDLVYQPMRDLLNYLRSNGFKTFIVSGGGIEFMRVFVESNYGIPPEQVVGSYGKTRFDITADGRPLLIKEPNIEFVDDGPGKPIAINRFIGRRPIFAFGNSDGDLPMLQWTAAGTGARFMGIVHHTDAEREWAYDRTSHIGKLDKALDEAARRGWTIASMKSDWKVIYPFETK